MSEDLTHLDEHGRAKMVNVGGKTPSQRRAVAEGRVRVSEELARAITDNTLKKGDLLQVAQLAGIQAAKDTSRLIPLCHNIPLDVINVEARLEGNTVRIRAETQATHRTGVEMEALTAVSVAALAVYDMGKAIDRSMVIEGIRLVEKTGGVRGEYHVGDAVDA